MESTLNLDSAIASPDIETGGGSFAGNRYACDLSGNRQMSRTRQVAQAGSLALQV